MGYGAASVIRSLIYVFDFASIGIVSMRVFQILSFGKIWTPVSERLLAVAARAGGMVEMQIKRITMKNVPVVRIDRKCHNTGGEIVESSGFKGIIQDSQWFIYYCGYLMLVILSLIHISEPTRRTPISYAVFC